MWSKGWKLAKMDVCDRQYSIRIVSNVPGIDSLYLSENFAYFNQNIRTAKDTECSRGTDSIRAKEKMSQSMY